MKRSIVSTLCPLLKLRGELCHCVPDETGRLPPGDPAFVISLRKPFFCELFDNSRSLSAMKRQTLPELLVGVDGLQRVGKFAAKEIRQVPFRQPREECAREHGKVSGG